MGSITVGEISLIFFLDPAQHLERVENQRRRGPKQVGGFSGDDAPVRQLNGQGGSRRFLLALTGCGDYGTILRSQARFLHDHLQPVHLRLLGAPLDLPATRGVDTGE